MKPEEALDRLDTLKDCASVEVLITDKDVEAFKLAIQAINDSEVYMIGADYDLYLEGYKQGLQDGQKDSKGSQGDIRWTDKVFVKSNGDIIDFEGRVVGHINLDIMKGERNETR